MSALRSWSNWWTAPERGPCRWKGRKLKAAVATLGVMAEMLADKDTTIGKLRELLTPDRTTEKTREVLDPAGAEEAKPEGQGGTGGAKAASVPLAQELKAHCKKGHGRNGPGAYKGAPKVSVTHPTLKRA